MAPKCDPGLKPSGSRESLRAQWNFRADYWWELIIGLIVEKTPGFALLQPSPLLEEERDRRVPALACDAADPCGIHRARAMAAFSPDHHPLDVAEINLTEVFQKRLDGKKARAHP